VPVIMCKDHAYSSRTLFALPLPYLMCNTWWVDGWLLVVIRWLRTRELSNILDLATSWVQAASTKANLKETASYSPGANKQLILSNFSLTTLKAPSLKLPTLSHHKSISARFLLMWGFLDMWGFRAAFKATICSYCPGASSLPVLR
jgi:hypothetical protein